MIILGKQVALQSIGLKRNLLSTCTAENAVALSAASTHDFALIYRDACGHDYLLAEAYAEALPGTCPALILFVQTFGDLVNFKECLGAARVRERACCTLVLGIDCSVIDR